MRGVHRESSKAIAAGTALFLLGVLCMHLVAYRNVAPSLCESIQRAPATLGYILRTTMPERPQAEHPLQDIPGGTGTDVPYDRPLALAFRALGRSLAAVGLALVWIVALSAGRAAVSIAASGPRGARLWLWTLQAPDQALRRIQRLPGLVVYFLLTFLLERLGIRTGESLFFMALFLSFVLANSDGVVPDLSDTLSHRYRELRQRDYVKAGRLDGRRPLTLMGRELAMTGADWLGGRMLQILSGAFLLELLYRYPGIGFLCVTNLFTAAEGAGSAGQAIARSDELYAVLLLMMAVSAAVIIARKGALRLLDPRPRTVVT